MYFILIKSFDGGYKAYSNINNEVQLFSDLEKAEDIVLKFKEASIFSLNHTIKEQMIVADKLAKLNNMLDEAIEVHNATTGEPQQP